ncbi:hypothetical protein ACJIZ3_001908 [Penstemon smallii]|uniref:Uncharacterized protein n=1 Tax=Penstemon smallii TaxID=265156 RepID=A0ABD3U5A4_9LAMI
MLNNLILERDQIIEMYQLKLMYFEEKVGPIERELQELKSQKSAVDQTMKEMRSKQSEADQMVEELKRKNIEASETIEGLNRKRMSYDQRMEEMKREKSEADKEIEQLRCQNFEASETIGELRRQMIGVEMEKTRYEKTIKEMKQKLSEADQTVDLLRRSNTEAFETMGELKRQRMEVEEVAVLNTKKLESLTPIIMRMKEGLANILNVEVQDMINIIKSNERSNAIPSSNGEKQNLGNSRMHACNVSLKTGSTNLPPQYSPIKEGNANESNGTDQGKECERLEESDCIEVICVDDETSPGGSELCAIVCGKEKIGEKFPLTSFALKRKSRDKKWLLGADMLNDFQEDEELCMNVVCVLYRQQISASESSTQDLDGGLSHSDALSVRALWEYLFDGGHGLRLGKTVCEVKQDRPDVLVECRRLATNYYDKLFRIYCNGEDPFFKLIKLYNL